MLNGLCEIGKLARSKHDSYKYKANHSLFFRIPLREEARYLLAYCYINQSDLSFCGQTLYLRVYWESTGSNSFISAGSQIFQSKSTLFQNFDRNLSSNSFI